MTIFFSFTILLSATLMFIIEPMFARMAMPYFGGSPSVWTTCVLFYQATILLAFLYVNFLLKKFSFKKQIFIHIALIFIPFIVLPTTISTTLLTVVQDKPLITLLKLLVFTIGLPFFVISTSTSILQKWFEKSNIKKGKDPYFLYAASNLGSLIGLLSYPILIEPNLFINSQGILWAFGYGILVISTIVCGIYTLLKYSKHKHNSPFVDSLNPTQMGETITYHAKDSRMENSSIFSFENAHDLVTHSSNKTLEKPHPIQEEISQTDSKVSYKQKFRWIIFSFIPSSLMLGITTYFSAIPDTSPIPFFYIIPLALYLISFIITFSSKNDNLVEKYKKHITFFLFSFIIFYVLKISHPVLIATFLHLVTFFVVAVTSHGILVRERPSPKFLVEFYLFLSIGGVLGGILNSIIAPYIFSSTLEYPLVMILFYLSLSFNDYKNNKIKLNFGDFFFPTIIFILVFTVMYFFRLQVFENIIPLIIAILFIFSSFVTLRIHRFAITLIGIFVMGLIASSFNTNEIYADRNFFGLLRVSVGQKNTVISLFHGNTLHGSEYVEPSKKGIPLSYYHETSPIGKFFEYSKDISSNWNVGVVGLGIGSLCAYKSPSSTWTFYEIDPNVIEIASNPNYFSYVNKFKPRIVLGDARLSLQSEKDGLYDVLVLDAYSSDAIPVHLISKEAMELYLKKLKPNGIVCFHLSNRILDLKPIVSNFSHVLNLYSLINENDVILKKKYEDGKFPSVWFFASKRKNSFEFLAKDSAFVETSYDKNAPIWTDEYSSIIRQIKLPFK